jgi:DNA-binding NarL/FixJ family response regulator
MRPVTVLLVDDNPTFLRITSRFLASHEWIVILGCAGSGQEALDLGVELRPDVILMDLNMVGMSGLDTIPQLRVSLPHTRIITLTLFDTQSYRSAALDSGASKFVGKSSMNRDLIPAILEVMKDDGTPYSFEEKEESDPKAQELP